MARILTYNELEHTVSELEKDLLAYKNAKEELALIFNAVPDHIAIIDKQFRIQRVNKALADRLKCKPEKLIGEPCCKYICMADSPPVYCPHAKMLSDGKERLMGIYIEQLRMDFKVTSSPLYDKEGKLIGGVLVARDIKKLNESNGA